jgi:uncharacterized protein
MSDRRRFLQSLAGGALAPLVLRSARSPGSTLTAEDAGAIRVELGIALPVKLPGVRIEYLRLLMPDGVRLAATLYLPETLTEKAPVILEVLPYRKDDDYLGRDLRNHGFYARIGIAGLRLDVRGTGASEGNPEDEYSVAEHEDTLHVIDWLSRQSWSNGNVGMTGISYGAFNSVQIAAMEPKALKAILAVAGTDDRYTDDVHYFGGALHLFENTWAVGMISSNAMPAAPGFDVRSAMAVERFDARPWILRWLHEQTDGPYWRRGSLRPDYARLKVPTFLVGGWLDGYHNFVPRIMRNAPAPSKGLLGPWPHAYPHTAHPGPRLDFRGLQARWWNEWLRGEKTGILDDPRIRYYSMSYFPPGLRLAELSDVPGEWRNLDSWPDDAFEPGERLFLDGIDGRRGLNSVSPEAGSLELRYRPAVGTSSKTWAPNGDGSYGVDQRGDDARALSFETTPLRNEVAILGFARARLFVSATAPVATWIVKLADVAPDGTSRYVSKGVLNGTHRSSHEKPEALVPGNVYELEIGLHCTAWRFAPGHRIRVVVSNADWPVVWPSPYPMTTSLFFGGGFSSHVDLPLDRARHRAAPDIGPPTPDPPVEGLRFESAPFVWQTTRDDASEATTFRFERGSRTVEHPAGFTADDGQVMVATVKDRDPATASLRVESFQTTRLADGRTVEARGEGELRSTETELVCELDVRLLENGSLVREKHWEERAKRNLL